MDRTIDQAINKGTDGVINPYSEVIRSNCADIADRTILDSSNAFGIYNMDHSLKQMEPKQSQ
jgi:hypothetical protein